MTRYDELTEVKKHDSEAKTFEEVLKFNPYHDALGRFSTANGAHSFTRFTQSKAGQKAIANIKAKQQAAGGGGGSPSAGSDSKKPAAPKKPKAKPKKEPQEQAPDIGNTKKQMKHKINSNSESWLENYQEDVTENTVKKLAKDLKVSKEEAERLANGIRDFSGSYSSEIRAASRGETSPQHIKDAAKACEDFIKASPKWAGGNLHRGINVDNDVRDQIVARAQKGQPIDMKGVSSWSSDKETANAFGHTDGNPEGAVIFHTNKKSTKHGTSIKHLSKYPNEDEVLMSANSVFTPTKIEKDKNGVVHIYGDMT